jgi:hypothetical protein
VDGTHRSGGSLELARLIDKAGEDLIPDLKHYYGIDLRDLFSEDNPLSPRWVLMHVMNLPIESAFMAEIRGGKEFRGWDEGRYMLASIYNVINILKYITILANSDPKKTTPEPPEPFPTPDNLVARKKSGGHKPGSFGAIALDLLGKAKKRKAAGG